MQKKISKEVGEEFSHQIKPENVGWLDIKSTVYQLIRDVCRDMGDDKSNKREEYCKVSN